MEKLISDSSSTIKSPDPFIRADQLCVTSDLMRTDEVTSRTTKDHNEETMRSEDTGDKAGTSDPNDPVKYTIITIIIPSCLFDCFAVGNFIMTHNALFSCKCPSSV